MSGLKSNKEWKQWGKEDPLFGVASWPGRDKNGASPWTEADFYALGQSDWEDFEKHWGQYGRNRASCLEIGCGAGRITRQLSAAFDRVYAVDVSEEMICVARQGVGPNVEFSLVDGQLLPYPNGSTTGIFSTHVLQHLDSFELGVTYFREFFRVLAAGGTLMVHLPLYQFPGGPLRQVMQTMDSVSRAIAQARADWYRKIGKKTMRTTPYPMDRLTESLTAIGFRNIELRVFETKSNRSPHAFVFATKVGPTPP
ncbi:MAG: class I SAM-dependent methyltransferase [Bryobacteraceae bacterium]